MNRNRVFGTASRGEVNCRLQGEALIELFESIRFSARGRITG